MLTPCNECGQRAYTEESPLWYVCDKCIKQYHKQLAKKHIEEYKAYRKERDTGICDGCGMEHRIIDLEYVEMWEGYFCDHCYESEVV